eukprot:2194715-Rhodomonas_salina.1
MHSGPRTDDVDALLLQREEVCLAELHPLRVDQPEAALQLVELDRLLFPAEGERNALAQPALQGHALARPVGVPAEAGVCELRVHFVIALEQHGVFGGDEQGIVRAAGLWRRVAGVLTDHVCYCLLPEGAEH